MNGSNVVLISANAIIWQFGSIFIGGLSLMERGYGRVMAVLNGFTLAKIADMVYFKLHNDGTKAVIPVYKQNTAQILTNKQYLKTRWLIQGGKHEWQ